MSEEQLDDLEQYIEKPHRVRRFLASLFVFVLVFLLLGTLSLFIFKTGFTFSQITKIDNLKDILPFANDDGPVKDEDRINILLLGLRGASDENGGLLTDSLMIVSLKKSTNQAALISVPRDLLVEIPGHKQKEKINFAYAFGQGKNINGGGLIWAKQVVSQVSDLYLDSAVAVNFDAFAKLVNSLGGVDIYRSSGFREDKQWLGEGQADNAFWQATDEGWAFIVPAGVSHLNGQAALYYTRSRFSTSDFDRMRRQQQVLMAIKDKAWSLKVLANPVKVFNLLDILGKNVKTDMSMNEMQDMVSWASALDAERIKTRVFDTSEQGLLYEAHVDGQYVLLPQGDNWGELQKACLEVFE